MGLSDHIRSTRTLSLLVPEERERVVTTLMSQSYKNLSDAINYLSQGREIRNITNTSH
jgi:hypothetical protein